MAFFHHQAIPPNPLKALIVILRLKIQPLLSFLRKFRCPFRSLDSEFLNPWRTNFPDFLLPIIDGVEVHSARVCDRKNECPSYLYASNSEELQASWWSKGVDETRPFCSDDKQNEQLYEVKPQRSRRYIRHVDFECLNEVIHT